MISKIGVRPQLSLIVLIAILPLLALLLFGVAKNRQLLLEAATTRALDLARFGAEQQDDAFQDAQTLLRTLRSMPRLSAASPDECHATLTAIGKEYPQFTSIGLIDAQGMIYCLSTDAKPRPVRDVEGFAKAQRADPQSFIFSKFSIGLISGKPVVIVSTQLPVEVNGGRRPVIAYVGVDLDRAARHAWDSGASANAVLCLVDPQTATILARSSNQLSLAGKKIEGSPLVAAMLANPAGGTIEAPDVEGTLRLFGFAPLRAGGGSEFMVAVGLPRADVLAAANWRLMMGLTVALLTAAIAAAAAWFIADRTQFRAIRSLVEAARRLGAGDMTARADMPPWQAPEFRELGKTLDDMAGGIARTQESLSASERKLRLLADNSTDMIMLVRPGGQCVYASSACRALLGYEPEEMLSIAAREAIHPDDLRVLDDRRNRGESRTTSTYRLRRKDGTYVWVESAARALPSEPGRPSEQVVVVRDIEARVAAEQRMRESELRYRFLAENAADVVFQYRSRSRAPICLARLP